MQAAYEAALDYACNRVVFGSPLIDYELSQVKLGRMVTIIQSTRQCMYRVARLMARGDRHDGSGDGQGVRVPCRRMGVSRGDAAPRWDGLRRGVPGVALLRRRAVLSIFEGSDEILALGIIARRLADRTAS